MNYKAEYKAFNISIRTGKFSVFLKIIAVALIILLFVLPLQAVYGELLNTGGAEIFIGGCLP